MPLRHCCANVLCTIIVHKSCTDGVIVSLLKRDHFLIVGIYFFRLRRTQLHRPPFLHGQRFRFTLDRKKNSSVVSEHSDNFDIVLSVRVARHIVSEMSPGSEEQLHRLISGLETRFARRYARRNFLMVRRFEKQTTTTLSTPKPTLRPIYHKLPRAVK